MKTTKNKPLTRNEIYVNEIEFRTREEVYLFGFLQHNGKFVETQYAIARKDLQMLLSQNKQVGIEILWRIEHLFVLPHAVPAALNLVELFGTTQVFEAREIRLEAAVYPGEPRLSFMFIEEVVPFDSPASASKNGGVAKISNH